LSTDNGGDISATIICTSIQKFGEVVVESIPCELTFTRKKNRQAQMMVAEISPLICTGSCFIFTYLE
jgi:hypothetical protein